MADGDTKRERYTGPLTLDNVSEAPAPRRAGVDLTQFKELVQASWDKVQANTKAEEAGQPAPHPNPGFRVTIPLAGRQLADSRFREAAGELGVGVSVGVIEPGTPQGNAENLTADKCILIVCARPKQNRPGRPRKDASAEAPKQGKGGLPPVKKAG